MATRDPAALRIEAWAPKPSEARSPPHVLGCSLGDLVSRLSNGPYGASYGLLWGLIGDAKWTY